MTLSKKRFSIYISYTHTFHLITYTLPKAILSIGISQKNKLSHKKKSKTDLLLSKKVLPLHSLLKKKRHSLFLSLKLIRLDPLAQ